MKRKTDAPLAAFDERTRAELPGSLRLSVRAVKNSGDVTWLTNLLRGQAEGLWVPGDVLAFIAELLDAALKQRRKPVSMPFSAKDRDLLRAVVTALSDDIKATTAPRTHESPRRAACALVAVHLNEQAEKLGRPPEYRTHHIEQAIKGMHRPKRLKSSKR